jgi:lipopolysaccharide export system protein LptA
MSPTPAPHTLRRLSVAALTLAQLAGPVRSLALEDDQAKPLYLESDSAELDDAKSISVYTGNVFIKQGSMEITGNQVTVHHDAGRKPTHIVAIGTPSTYRQEMEGEEQEVQAEALRMEYDASKDEITLIDKAVLFQGEDTFRSDRIVYDRTKDLVKAGTSAQGKERVKITITPSKR